METLTELNLGQQSIDESTKLIFDSQQAGDNMDIDDNNYFEKLEEDPPPGNGQGQNQRADQLAPTGAAGQTAGQTAQPLPTGIARQVNGQVRSLDKTLQQEFKKLSAQRAEAQLCACVKQLCRETAKSFLLKLTITAEKQPNCKKLKTVKELTLRDNLAMEKVKTVKDLDSPYSRKFQKTLDNFVRQVDNIFLAKSLTYATEQDKCRYVGDFLHSILADNWKAYDHWNLKIDNPQYTYAELKLILQERLLPRHIR